MIKLSLNRVIAITFLSLLAGVQLVFAQQADRVLAFVDSVPITQSEYDSFYKQMLINEGRPVTAAPQKINTDILQTLINRQIQLQYAQQKGITVNPEKVTGIIENIAANNNLTTGELFDQLERNGISRSSFIRNMNTQNLIQTMLEQEVYSRVNINDEEIKYHMQSNPERYQINQSYEIAHLPIFTDKLNDTQKKQKLQKALQAQQALANGDDFTTVFTQYSEGGDASKYGYMGWRQYNELPDLFVKSLQNLTPGSVSEVIDSDSGYHIIKLLNKRGDDNVVTQNLTRRIVISPQRRNLTPERALKLANAIVEEIRLNRDFTSAAKQYSDDSLSAANGGSIGWVNPNDTPAEINRVISTLKLNQVSGPIVTPGGIQILQVTDRRQRDIGLELLKKDAQNAIFQKKAQTAHKNLFANLRSKAYIQIVNTN